METIIFQGDSVKGSIEEVFNIADKNLCCNTTYQVFKMSKKNAGVSRSFWCKYIQ